MIIWLALLIPVLGVIVLYSFFHKKVAWWENIMIIMLIVCFIYIMKFATELSQTSDTEYIQDYINRVEYYEDWNEEVSCRHPKYCDIYNSCKSKDSKGNCQSGYDREQCGYEHIYDIDYHPEYWVMISTRGGRYNISKGDYFRLLRQFQATPIFKDLERDYHDDDGDMYYFEWNKKVETVEYITTTHNYENRVQASHSVINFPKVDTSYIHNYGLYDYPQVKNLEASALLGENNLIVNRYINQTNALYACSKQVKVFYLIYKNKPLDAALLQEQYWKGGNKNEVVICIGIDDKRKIKWSYVFSWTKREEVKIHIRDYIKNQNYLDYNTYKNIIDYSNREIIKRFERRHFKEFSYLKVEPTITSIVWTFVISLLLTIGMSIFIIYNEINN